MNNSSDCAWYDEASQQASTIIYYFIYPLFLFLALLGRCLTLKAFHRQSQKDQPYMYQIFLTASETLSNVFGFFYLVSARWIPESDSNPISDYLMTSRSFAWFTAHIPIPLTNTFGLASLYLAIAVVSDRVFAMAKPFRYKNINRKWHQPIALISCILIGLVGNVSDWFYYAPEVDDRGRYRLGENSNFAGSTAGIALMELRNVLFALGLIILVTSNFFLLKYFRKRMRKVGDSGRPNTNHDAAQQKRDQQYSTLCTLAWFQGGLNCVNALGMILFGSVFYHFDIGCKKALVFACFDAIFTITDSVHFYAVLAASREFRRMVLAIVPGGSRLLREDRSTRVTHA